MNQEHAGLRTARLSKEPVTVVGINDWAFRRNHRYWTIVCDLQGRRKVTLLPDQEMATSAAWLADHPEIRILSHDRGGDYGAAATRALPDAIQVDLLFRMSSDLASHQI